MKLARIGKPGKEVPAIIAPDGTVHSLAGIVPDITPATLAPASLAKLAKLKLDKLPVIKRPSRYGVPVNGVSKFIAIGLNYRDHAQEAGMAIPTEPIIFTKAITSLCGAQDDVVLPTVNKTLSVKSDWEVELGIVIGTMAKSVPQTRAMDYVAGYCVVNDVSEREYQLERGGTWDKGKSFDTFGPVGPWLVTKDEVANPQKLNIWLDLNGVPTQRGNTKTMIFNVKQLVAYVSQMMTLMPGDIITTGTPVGVGMGAKPPRFLRAGDVMTLGIEGLGQQQQTVVAKPR